MHGGLTAEPLPELAEVRQETIWQVTGLVLVKASLWRRETGHSVSKWCRPSFTTQVSSAFLGVAAGWGSHPAWELTCYCRSRVRPSTKLGREQGALCWLHFAPSLHFSQLVLSYTGQGWYQIFLYTPPAYLCAAAYARHRIFSPVLNSALICKLAL